MTVLDTALVSIQSLVENDGYDVRLDDFSDGALKLTILARPNACEECLVPKEIMAAIIANTLPAELGSPEIVLTYPAESD